MLDPRGRDMTLQTHIASTCPHPHPHPLPLLGSSLRDKRMHYLHVVPQPPSRATSPTTGLASCARQFLLRMSTAPREMLPHTIDVCDSRHDYRPCCCLDLSLSNPLAPRRQPKDVKSVYRSRHKSEFPFRARIHRPPSSTAPFRLSLRCLRTAAALS